MAPGGRPHKQAPALRWKARNLRAIWRKGWGAWAAARARERASAKDLPGWQRRRSRVASRGDPASASLISPTRGAPPSLHALRGPLLETSLAAGGRLCAHQPSPPARYGVLPSGIRRSASARRLRCLPA
eukprot:scaffold2008_cov283-Pinguiococcus_pyrenoidosus.AAC.2